MLKYCEFCGKLVEKSDDLFAPVVICNYMTADRPPRPDVHESGCRQFILCSPCFDFIRENMTETEATE